MKKEEVEKIAYLARLSLSEEEKELFAVQLGCIFKYFERLEEVDTIDISPTTHVVSLFNAFREDMLKDSLDCEQVFASAPDREETLFKVPKIIE